MCDACSCRKSAVWIGLIRQVFLISAQKIKGCSQPIKWNISLTGKNYRQRFPVVDIDPPRNDFTAIQKADWLNVKNIRPDTFFRILNCIARKRKKSFDVGCNLCLAAPKYINDISKSRTFRFSVNQTGRFRGRHV